MSTNHKERPYDKVIPSSILKVVRKHRLEPYGREYPVGRSSRGLIYPWGRLRLGDWFWVPLNGRSRNSVVVRFYQAAARRDWELTVRDWEVDRQPGLQIWVSYIGISVFRRAAGLQVSKGSWPRADRVKKPKRFAVSEAMDVAKSTPIAEVPPEGVDASTQPGYVPVSKLTREQIIARSGFSGRS